VFGTLKEDRLFDTVSSLQALHELENLMQKLKPVWTWISVAVCCACGSTDEIDENSGTESRSSNLSQAGLESERESIRSYFREKREAMNIVATTVTSFGQIIDWTVPTEEELFEPPPRSREPLEPPPKGFVYATSPLETEPDARGPAGTVPNVRPDIDGLLKAWGDEVPAHPDQIFDVVPAPNPDGKRRYHAIRRSVSPTGFRYQGASGRVSLWDAPQLATGDTSIMQIFLGGGRDTIESGKLEFSGAFSGAPYLFIWFTNRFYGDFPQEAGYCVQGYINSANQISKGYFTAANTNWPPEMIFQNLNTNPILTMLWERGLNDGEWYFYVNNEYAGIFRPRCFPSGGGSATMWHATDNTANAGLLTGAPRAEWYGEVYNSSAVCTTMGMSTTCTGASTTDMGNGLHASNVNSAWIDYMTVKSGSSLNWVSYNNIPSIQRQNFTTDAACYSQSSVTTSTHGFYLGGGGTGDANCPTP
jgi:hypothetical protein